MDPSLPTVVITHGWQPLPTDKFVKGADQFPARPVYAGCFAFTEGNSLAKQLETLLGPNYSKEIQFIGQCLGSIVNAAAVNVLPGFKGCQFTILEAPLLLTLFNEEDFHSLLRPAPVVEWVENYIGNENFSFGDLIAGAAPNGGAFVGANHVTVQESFYVKTIADDSWTESGFDFSRLLGDKGGYSRRPAPQLWNPPIPSRGAASFFIESLVEMTGDGFRRLEGGAEQVVQNISGQIRSGIRLFKALSGSTEPAAPARAAMARVAPAQTPAATNSTVVTELAVPPDASHLSFDFLFAKPGNGDWLTASFNDTLLFSFRGDSFSGTNFQSASIPLTGFAGRSGALTFKLNSAGDAPAEVTLSNFQIMTDQSIDEGSQLSFTVSAADADLPAQTLRFSLEPEAPAGARIDPASGLFSWTPSEEQGPGTNRITVRVADSGVPGFDDTRAFSVIVREVNSPPVISSIADKFLEENSRLEFAVEATDPDVPKNAFTFALSSDAPAGASIEPRTGVFGWTAPAVATAQTNRISVRVIDDGSPPMEATATMQVLVTPAKLRLAQIPDRTEDEGAVIAFVAAVMDSPLAQPPFTYALETGAPAGALISPNSGAFLWQPTEAQGPSTNTITVRVTDSSNPPLTASRRFTVIVREVNRPPVLEAISPQRVTVGQLLNLTVKAQDPDLPSNELTYSLEPGAPAGASIDAKTGLFSWTPGPPAAGGTNSITIKVADNGLPPLSHTVTFTVAVTAPEGPRLLGSFLPNGQFQLTLNGEIGRIYLIQSSADLAAWKPLTNVLRSGTTVQIVDSDAASVKQRFYRALSP